MKTRVKVHFTDRPTLRNIDSFLRASLIFISAVAIVIVSSIAFASLGGTAASIDADTSTLHARHVQHAAHALYSVHDVVYGTQTVKEYLNNQGVVFAVTWSGTLQPNLETIFGTYYAEFKAEHANSIRRHGVRNQKLTTANLSIERWGHMRSMHGKAILTAAVPTGVMMGDIQ